MRSYAPIPHPYKAEGTRYVYFWPLVMWTTFKSLAQIMFKNHRPMKFRYYDNKSCMRCFILDITATQWDNRYPAPVWTPDRVTIRPTTSVGVHKASQHPILRSLRWVSSQFTNHPIPHISIPSSPDLSLLLSLHPAGRLFMQCSHKTTRGSLLTALGHRNPQSRQTRAEINLRLCDKLR